MSCVKCMHEGYDKKLKNNWFWKLLLLLSVTFPASGAMYRTATRV
jgi:hypothetical protein